MRQVQCFGPEIRKSLGNPLPRLLIGITQRAYLHFNMVLLFVQNTSGVCIGYQLASFGGLVQELKEVIENKVGMPVGQLSTRYSPRYL